MKQFDDTFKKGNMIKIGPIYFNYISDLFSITTIGDFTISVLNKINSGLTELNLPTLTELQSEYETVFQSEPNKRTWNTTFYVIK